MTASLSFSGSILFSLPVVSVADPLHDTRVRWVMSSLSPKHR